ncbi:MAG: hypothetical protein JWM21_3515 [Acidobacteria bacterium]|nr:hypothetical protein [Acidobacteriota bacterium]
MIKLKCGFYLVCPPRFDSLSRSRTLQLIVNRPDCPDSLLPIEIKNGLMASCPPPLVSTGLAGAKSALKDIAKGSKIRAVHRSVSGDP